MPMFKDNKSGYPLVSLIFILPLLIARQRSLLMSHSHLITPLINGSNTVQVEIYDLQILKVNDIDNTIDLSFILYLEWIDPRLNSNHVSKYIPIDKSLKKLLWLPDITIFPGNFH